MFLSILAYFFFQLIVEDLNRDLESFTEKIAEFAQGKQTAEKK